MICISGNIRFVQEELMEKGYYYTFSVLPSHYASVLIVTREEELTESVYKALAIGEKGKTFIYSNHPYKVSKMIEEKGLTNVTVKEKEKGGAKLLLYKTGYLSSCAIDIEGL